MTKQAKVLSQVDVERVLDTIDHHVRDKERARLIFFLSLYCGLRSCEIGALTLENVLGASGEVGEYLELAKQQTKGKLTGRRIPLHPKLLEALRSYLTVRSQQKNDSDSLLVTNRGRRLSANFITVSLFNLYKRAGVNASSHSGRRSFCTRMARDLAICSASLRDIQILMGHKNLASTQRYIDGSEGGQKKLIARLKF